jgi:hypothetical protein
MSESNLFSSSSHKIYTNVTKEIIDHMIIPIEYRSIPHQIKNHITQAKRVTASRAVSTL